MTTTKATAATEGYIVLRSWTRGCDNAHREIFGHIHPSREDAFQAVADEISTLLSAGDEPAGLTMDPAPVMDEGNSNHNHGALRFRPEDIADISQVEAWGPLPEGIDDPRMADWYECFEIEEVSFAKDAEAYRNNGVGLEIFAIRRSRCWNRAGVLFPSPDKAIVEAVPSSRREAVLAAFLDGLSTRPVAFEEGFGDLVAEADGAKRIIRLLDRYGNDAGEGSGRHADRIVVDYGEDDGLDSPVLVETYEFITVDTGWAFRYDEEFHHDFSPWDMAGVLTDGARFLFWNVVGQDEGKPICRIHNSIAMNDDTLECEYPWSSANDEMVIEHLNGLDDADGYCGEMCALQRLPFRQADGE